MRIRTIVPLLLAAVAAPGLSAQDTEAPGRERQVGEAVLAAPEAMRAAATVLGYGGQPRPSDPLTVLREGTNDLICLADDPAADGFHVACYHRSLDDFMALGRRLRAEGKDGAQVMDERYSALEAGSLVMPERAALYSLTAEGGAPSPEGARRLIVVYVPGATVEEMGLPDRPGGGWPWLMLPGTPWAHVMISRQEN